MNLLRMSHTQQYFQIIAAAMSNYYDGQIELSNGDIAMSAKIDGRWLVLNFSNENDMRTLYMGWSDTFNTDLRSWMFGVLDLWERHATDEMIAQEDAQEEELLDPEVCQEMEDEMVGAFDEAQATQAMIDAQPFERYEEILNNPWADRWENTYQDGDRMNDALIRMEAQEARQQPAHPCTNEDCEDYEKDTAYYRPGVGGWWCSTCGEYSLV
jgi:hypothetical protein